MRACLAILKDSFREAAASRILSIALVAILVVLLALSPLGLSSAQSTQLRPFELIDTERFLKSLTEGKSADETPAAHLWSLMDDDQRSRIEAWQNPDSAAQDKSGNNRPGRVKGKLLGIINELLTKPDFYRPEVWSPVKMDESLKPADEATISSETRTARNLQRLGAAFTQSLDVSDDLSVSLSYGTMVLFGPLQGAPQQTQQLIDETIIVVLAVFLGFFGVFSSLLVTASIIPRTFEPGEISLLLSKPVRRSVLFVTKFFGGCVFTLLCATLLVTGIWFLLWVRFDLWRPELLLCIPLYVFMFAVYFSVSALAGAIWKNPTVSLIIVVVFWIIVTTTGAIHRFATNGYFQTQQIVEVTAAGSEVFVVDGARKIRRWDSATADWAGICDDGRGGSLLQLLQRLRNKGLRQRLVASDDGTRLIGIQGETSRFGDAAPATLFSGEQDNNFIREVETTTPEPVFAVFRSKDGHTILPGMRSVYQYVGISEQARKTQAFLQNTPLRIFAGPPARAFEILTSRDAKPLRADAAVAFNLSNDSLVFWDNGTMSTLIRSEDGKYAVGETRVFEKQQPAVIATGGEFILCALADGTVMTLNATTLETVAEEMLPDGEKPKVAEFAADGSWGAVMTHGGYMSVFAGQQKSFVPWRPQENGSVSAIRFDQSGKMIVANGRRSVSFYEPGSESPVKTLSGLTAWPYTVYDFIVHPLYTLLPKPGEVDQIVRFLVTGEKSEVIGGDHQPGGAATEDLNQQRVTFNIWQCFWSNFAFIAVMLTAGCVYLIRRDF
jgi:ABC-type transport system involved in multi-copper enzyme maturation permease subunit